MRLSAKKFCSKIVHKFPWLGNFVANMLIFNFTCFVVVINNAKRAYQYSTRQIRDEAMLQRRLIPLRLDRWNTVLLLRKIEISL